MTEGLHLSPRHREKIKALLRKHLPDVEAWAYGSRVNGRSHDGSDLDLVLRGPKLAEIDTSRLAEFTEALRESTVPFLVEARDWARLPESFHREIEREHVVLVEEEELGTAGEWRETIYGRVASYFVEDCLVNLCNQINGVQTGPFGSQLHKKDYVSVGTPIITVEHLGDNRILHEDVPHVSDHDRERLSKYILHDGDIVFSRVGSVDRRALVKEAESGWLFSGRCLRVRPDPNKIDSGYLSYFFSLPSFKEHIRAIAVGATMPSLNTQILSDIVVPHPRDLNEQRTIAHILGTLDDKIELNRRMNETLEAMARALFKSWFVDFDPVRAKMEGRDTGLPQRLAALFPARLVNSELGPIPQSWEVKALGDCIKVARGLSYSGSGLSSNGVPMHNLNSIYEGGGYKEEGIKYYDGDYKPRHVTTPGDVIVANTEQGHDRLLIGYAAVVPALFGNLGLFSHHLYQVRPKVSGYLTPDFICQLLNTQIMHDVVSGYATGTTVNMLPADALTLPLVVLPRSQIVAVFDDVAKALRFRQGKLIDESKDLAALRDTLLPKLISGVCG